jgi:hypothetical protein
MASKRIVVIDGEDDSAPYFADWSAEADAPVEAEDECPITSPEHAEFLGLKRAGINELSMAWGITRLRAARFAFDLSETGSTAYAYDPGYWEAVATSRARSSTAGAPERPTEREDPTEARRSRIREVLAASPTTREALVDLFKVSDRTIDGDLAEVSAVKAGKDGRKTLWTVAKDESDATSEDPE